jgi:hypothetical protein
MKLGIVAMLFLLPVIAQQPAAKKPAASRLPPKPSLEQRVMDLEQEVIDLQRQLAALAASVGKPVPAVTDSWETEDLKDDLRALKQTHRLSKTAKSLVVNYFEQRNIGGVGGRAPVNPPRQTVLVPGQNSTVVLSPGPIFPCSWIFGLSGDGNTLSLDATHCTYPTGYRAAFNLTINP